MRMINYFNWEFCKAGTRYLHHANDDQGLARSQGGVQKLIYLGLIPGKWLASKTQRLDGIFVLMRFAVLKAYLRVQKRGLRESSEYLVLLEQPAILHTSSFRWNTKPLINHAWARAFSVELKRRDKL